MDKKTTENAVEFIWQAQITKDFYNSSSLKEIYDWLLNIAKSECDAKGTRIVNNKINVSFEFLLQSEFVLITVKQSVYLD
ncbi:MAG: hypothetical protein E7508_06520 [Ruminococcus sp.]|nr:hypothetical protein [Ruminococcus sp.]